MTASRCLSAVVPLSLCAILQSCNLAIMQSCHLLDCNYFMDFRLYYFSAIGHLGYFSLHNHRFVIIFSFSLLP